MVDAVDRKILGLLAENARMTNSELAGRLGMAPSGALKRVRRLEEDGVITRYETRVSEAALGMATTSFVKVFTNERLGRNDVGRPPVIRTKCLVT